MWSEAFLKAVRWLILAELVVFGTWSFIKTNYEHKFIDAGRLFPSDKISNTDEFVSWSSQGVWTFVTIFCYGMIFILGHFWKDFDRKVLLISVGVFVALSILSSYAPEALYVLFGFALNAFHPLFLWVAIMPVLGVPIMTLIYKKMD